MFSRPIREMMEQENLLIARRETTVVKAAQLMAKRNMSAVMVMDKRRLVGIFTERDAVFRVIAKGLDPENAQLGNVMTIDPITVAPDKSFGYALLVMHENGIRHLPVIEKGQLIGVVCARDALDPDLEELISESQRRDHILRERSGA